MSVDRDPQPGTRVAIEVADGAVRARSADGVREADQGDVQIALSALDDDLALVRGRIAPSRAVWAALLESLVTDENLPVQLDAVVVVHPTTWGPGRRALLSNAARTMAATVTMQSRAVALAERVLRADVGGRASLVVEVSTTQVAIVFIELNNDGTPVACLRHLEERSWSSRSGAEVVRTVAEHVRELAQGAISSVGAVLVDSADLTFAEELVRAIDHTGITAPVSSVGPDAVFSVFTHRARSSPLVHQGAMGDSIPAWVPVESIRMSRKLDRPAALLAGCLVVVAVVGAVLFASRSDDHRATRPATPSTSMATSLLVEGQVQLMVPTTWAVRRIAAGGAGSARVEVISPENPELMIHVTQARVSTAETLQSSAATLRSAMDKEPPGVFIDFKADDRRTDRPAVTYVEVRPGHNIAWTVLLDGQLRIGIGCQSPRDSYAALRQACELAIRTAHMVASDS